MTKNKNLSQFGEIPVIINGVHAIRQPSVTEEDKNHYCLKSSRERLLWGHDNKIKPCSLCTGVSIEDTKGFNNLVEDISNGVRRIECKNCWEQEDNGLYSYRQYGNMFWSTIHHGNSHTEFVFNRTCNAACIYCNADYSTTWQKELEQTQHEIPGILISPKVLNSGSPSVVKQKALDLIEELAKDHNKFACIGVYGGEPTLDLIESNYLGEFISHFYLHNKMWNRRIRYDINTNLNFSQKRCYQIIEYLKKCSAMYPCLDIIIQPSFESTDKNYNFVRYGCNWHNTEKNLDIFLKETNFKIEIKSKINNFSLKEFPTFIRQMNKKCKNIRPFDIEIDYIYNPKMFSLEILDTSFTKYISDFWYYIENNRTYFSNIDDMIVQLKRASKFIGSCPKAEIKEHVDDAVKVYDYFKKQRNMDILEYNPELYYYFKMVNISENSG